MLSCMHTAQWLSFRSASLTLTSKLALDAPPALSHTPDHLECVFAEPERPPSDDASTASNSVVDRIFSMKTVQRTQCLTGAPDERLRYSRTFQVCCTSCLTNGLDGVKLARL